MKPESPDLFANELARRAVDPAGRRWLFVPYDQLTDRLGPLAREDPHELGVVVVESPWKAARRPYHKHKLALIVANLRHFALEQAARGVAVRRVVARGRYAKALAPVAAELGPLRVMRPAERELRADLAPLVRRGALEEIPHEGWMTTPEQFEAGAGTTPPWRMDAFYRRVRRDKGILMQGGRPAGGKFSFDAENRKRWRGEPPAPEPPRFEPDAVTEEVGALIEARFSDHPGTLDLATLPATADDARRLWKWAKTHCLAHFGPYEDAMSERSSTLFHTRISPLLNLLRLLPAEVVADAAALDVPLASKEGFVRQILGWREFVRHVHERTDGFRSIPGVDVSIAARPGDGGWSAWKGRRWKGSAERGDPDGGAAPSHLGSDGPVPPAWWGEPSGLRCLDRVVADVWATGWSHHITRLMVLGNLATLLDVAPRALADWFWVAYVDAFDWVVEPNVLAMATYGAGDRMTTKPYVAGAAYIARMSDHCGACAFDPKRDCPITRLYWAFLDRHRARLEDNPRIRLPLRSLARRSAAKRRGDRETFERVRAALGRGERLTPANCLPDEPAS